MKTIGFECAGAVNQDALDAWLRDILWENHVPSTNNKQVECLRIKALIHLPDNPHKMVVQSVRELYDVIQGAVWEKGTIPVNKLVFIGRHLDRQELMQSFMDHCLI